MTTAASPTRRYRPPARCRTGGCRRAATSCATSWRTSRCWTRRRTPAAGRATRRRPRPLPVLRTSKVDLYICGHDHHLELVAGRPRMLVSGAGSDPIPPVALHPSTLYPADAKRQGGFAVVELTATQMTITFYGMDGRAVGHAYAFAR